MILQETISAIAVNLRMILNRVEDLKLGQPDYEVNAKLGKIELKVDEINDLLIEVEALVND